MGEAQSIREPCQLPQTIESAVELVVVTQEWRQLGAMKSRMALEKRCADKGLANYGATLYLALLIGLPLSTIFLRSLNPYCASILAVRPDRLRMCGVLGYVLVAGSM